MEPHPRADEHLEPNRGDRLINQNATITYQSVPVTQPEGDMLRFLYRRELDGYPDLQSSMHIDRKLQFQTRLKWKVTVDPNGLEVDEYDGLDPLYVIVQRPGGRHAASIRFLPTLGRTMFEEHFNRLAPGVSIRSPKMWEATRMCVSPNGDHGDVLKLLLGASEVGRRHGLTHALGVFETKMLRVYRSLGWSPMVLGTDAVGTDNVAVGLWQFSSDVRKLLFSKTNLSLAYLEKAYAEDRQMRTT